MPPPYAYPHWRAPGRRLYPEQDQAFFVPAAEADLYTVFALTDPAGEARGITAFLVEKGTPGLRNRPRQKGR